jgi:L-ornithine N5-oxygenase
MEDRSSPPNGDGGTYELIGVGFGPAGIALATAIDDAREERPGTTPWRSVFLEEAAADTAWQGELLLPETDIQHHFLRDFATPRNPRSRYTFANYLKEEGRLFSFGLQGGNPGRIEWADYCRWICAQLSDRVLHRHRVTAIEPLDAGSGKPIDLLRIRALNLDRKSEHTLLAENVVACVGRRPQVPELYEPWLGERAFHSHTFLTSMSAIPAGEGPTIAVIGSGESAIEIILYLLDRYPRSEFLSIHRNSGFRLHDAGAFSNEIFFPEAVDCFYPLPKKARRTLIEEAKLTNYSAVDCDVGKALYRRIYEDRILGRNRVEMIRRSNVREVTRRDGRFELTVEDMYREVSRRVEADVLVLCTGYFDEAVPSVLDGVRPLLELDDEGNLDVSRDYEVHTAERLRAGIFVNGTNELTHGISDATSFSMMCLKAARTLERLEARRASLRPAPVVAAEVAP